VELGRVDRGTPGPSTTLQMLTIHLLAIVSDGQRPLTVYLTTYRVELATKTKDYEI
jgi:hypothetical protein